MFAGNLEDHLSELAHHYRRSDNVAKAVEYLGQAGQQALRRSAHADAISSLGVAINLLLRLPDSREHIQRELLLQFAIGSAFGPVMGGASSEVERAYTRALELCEQLGETLELFAALRGLWLMYVVRGELRTAYELAERLRRPAQTVPDQVPLMYEQSALAATSYWTRELLSAREHLEMVLPPF